MGELFRRICTKDMYRNAFLVSFSRSVFKSSYSIEKLYPSSNQDILADQLSTVEKLKAKNSKEFSGYIPLENLDISYARSSGPGGQHVNKVNTKVTVKFHVNNANWIPEIVKPKLQEQEKQRITKNGFLIVSSDRTRKQLLNQADCVDKIRQMIRQASYTPPFPDPVDEIIKQQRLEASRRSMVREKREHSLKKQRRRADE